MPAYNCEKYISQAIDSIINQTHKNFELLIADDCSSDNTKSIIDAYDDKRIKTFHNEINLGYLQASNKLFAICQGEFITFQDADDCSDITRLEKLVFFLENNPSIHAVGSNIIKIDINNNFIYQTNFALTTEQIKIEFKNYRTTFVGSALMLRKELLSEIGFYNIWFDRIGSEDIYMYSLILDKHQVANLPDYLYYYRTNPQSLSATHANLKSTIGLELIIEMHNRRQLGKEDYIKTNNITKVNKHVVLLLTIKEIQKNKFHAIIHYVKNLIKYSKVSVYYFRRFFSTLKSALLSL
jgi:glycosyltransferase involved in cell wall biosynthesis